MSSDVNSTQINLPKNLSDVLIKWSIDNIKDEWLHTYGRELEPHVTILYGLNKNVTANDVQKLVSKNTIKQIDFSLSEISKFDNEDFTVVKFSIPKSKSLYSMHRLLKTLPNQYEYGDSYQPHCTIAYINKSYSRYIEKFIGLHIFSKCDITTKSFLFSDINETKTKILL